MLVSQENFVKVHGDIDLVVGEVAKPSSVRANCIGQQRENFRQGDVNGIAYFAVGDTNRGRLFLGTVVDAKMIGTHGTDSFLR